MFRHVIFVQNIETVPKAQIVSACLNEQESCPTKNEAEHLLAEWKTLLQNCDSVEDKQQLKEAVDGVSNVAFKSRNDSLSNWYPINPFSINPPTHQLIPPPINKPTPHHQKIYNVKVNCLFKRFLPDCIFIIQNKKVFQRIRQ